MRSSIITVTYNNAEILARHWTKFASDESEWIVVDNASTDGTADVAAGLGATVIRLDQNVGFSAANNVGVRSSSGDILHFINPDVTISSRGIRVLAETAESSRGIVAPQLRNYDGSLQANGRGLPFPHHKILHRHIKPKWATARYLRFASAGEIKLVCWVIGAAVSMTRETFVHIGGWDARYFIYYEDSDICLRAWMAQRSVSLIGDVIWTHGWQRATLKAKREPWKHEIRSATKFYARFPDLVIPGIARRSLAAMTAADRVENHRGVGVG